MQTSVSSVTAEMGQMNYFNKLSKKVVSRGPELKRRHGEVRGQAKGSLAPSDDMREGG